MALITAAEVSTIAFVNSLDPALILPVFISTAQTKFIVPTVTQIIIDKITETPSEYTILVDDYIKPYLAFAVKYMFYNQLLTETDTFPTSDEQRSAALQEVLAIMEVSRDLLISYLNANIFETPITTFSKSISGFRTGYSTTSGSGAGSSSSNTNVTDALNGASVDVLSDPDTLNFIQFTTGLLRKLSWSNFKISLKAYFDSVYASYFELITALKCQEIPFEFNNIITGTIQTYLLDIKCLYPYTILSSILETDTGTLIGVNVKIESTAVTGLSSVSVSATVSETLATALNHVAAGNRITISTSASFTGFPTTLRGKLKILLD